MLSFIIAAALALPFHGASAAPQTFSPNSTAIFPSGPAVTKAPTGNCSNNCAYPQIDLGFITWSQMSITATYTAATVVLIVNKRNNSTRTTTISNTEIDFGKIATPTNLNSDGTVTASVVDNDGSTRVIAYPTSIYSDYAPNITWTGTLSTTVSGTPTCSIAPTGAVAVFPSHPLLPEGVQATGVNTIEDPRGWTFVPMGDRTCGDTGDLIEDFFPGLGVWNCEASGDCVGPIGALQTALYLTKTSTSTEPDTGPTPPPAPASSTQQPVAQPEKTAPAETPTSNAPPAETPSSTETPPPEASPTETPPVAPPPPPASTSIVITPSPGPAPTAPVAIPVPVTSTDAKGRITISTSTAVAHPIVLTTTNAQGRPVPTTSLSTASISASVPLVLTSTNAHGTILSSTTHLPAIILTATDAAGSESLTTSALTPPLPLPITVGAETITPNPQSQYLISGQTLSPGSSITLGAGPAATVLTLQTSGPSAPALVYGPRTSPLPSPALLTIGADTVTPNPHSQYLISGSTLAVGSPVTIGAGTVLALQTSGAATALVYAARTSVLTPTALAFPPAIVLGSETITANGRTQYVVGSQTLTAGGAVTVGGTRVSLAAGGSDVVVGSSTEALAPYITAGFGAGANGTTPSAFTGGAEGRGGRGWGPWCGCGWAVFGSIQ
ncbi:hypothetical protein HO173_011337 [Letharia columbiana]|uniref:Uncharacterized protein n=1 Tax=Letharia columbiana TaxID=112416 RepID=A0A8H6FJG0_9LECA|nr:uncharacterized protein HO173_011337 [Letharia columbiana]KAF6229691.1 hypothetical protein HO173_011337 [Letharia columbiana]